MTKTLPTEQQRERMMELVQAAFVEIRLIATEGKGQQASDLADAFHNLPREIYGWGSWDIGITRGMLQDYQDKYHQADYSGMRDYVGMFDAIFPPSE